MQKAPDRPLRETETLLGDLGGMSAEEVNLRFAMLIADAEMGTAPTLADDTFNLLVAELRNKPRRFTFVDLFCGAGGSSIGLTMAGGLLLFAANHSKRVIETHMANFRDAEHKTADLNHYDMRNIPAGADVLWASPICTEISPAGGRKRRTRKDNPGQLALMRDGHVPKDVFERTRATFADVIRATEIHLFRYVLVENVVEAALDWKLFWWWLQGMVILGYQWQIVCVSAAHVGDQTNPYAPQRRDRMYIVFNREDCVKPDVAPRPLSVCPECGPVQGVQWWKKPEGTLTESGQYLHVGKYGRNGQYLYRCPNWQCRNAIVTPLERPAASIIDWTDLGIRIGDRPAHGLPDLKPNSLRRIDWGLNMFSRPDMDAEPAGPPSSVLVNSAHNDDRAYPCDRAPLPAATTKIGFGVASPADAKPFIVKNYSGRPQDRVRTVNQPFGAVTTGRNQSLVVPPGSFIDTLRNNVRPTSVGESMTTVSAQGNHHGLVVPYYTKGKASSTDSALPTVTTKDRFGLVQGATLNVLDCYYRMIQWYEQSRAQGFPSCYLITGNNGERTAQAGNAVPRNVAQWLGECIADALNKTAAAGY